jgi:hypothetical protein
MTETFLQHTGKEIETSSTIRVGEKSPAFFYDGANWSKEQHMYSDVGWDVVNVIDNE